MFNLYKTLSFPIISELQYLNRVVQKWSRSQKVSLLYRPTCDFAAHEVGQWQIFTNVILGHQLPYFVSGKTSPRWKEQHVDESDSDNEPLQRLVHGNEQNNMNTSDEHLIYQEYITQCNETIMVNDRERQAKSKDNVQKYQKRNFHWRKRKRLWLLYQQ